MKQSATLSIPREQYGVGQATFKMIGTKWKVWL